jgi:hypothetical protein
MLRWLMLMLIVLLAACGGGDEDTPEVNVQTTGGDNLDDNLAEVIQWDTDPETIVFRAELSVPDSDQDRFMRSQIPLCTIYGDGRVVWPTVAEDPSNNVLFGPVDDVRIRRFIDNITVLYRIFTFTEEAPFQDFGEIPEAYRLIVSVNGQTHVADDYGGLDEQIFEDILERCQMLSPRPQIFLPDGLWVRAEAQEYDNNAPSVVWDSEVTGIDLREIATSGEAQWASGRIARILWNYRQRSASPDLQYSQDGGIYTVTLEIPRVTRHWYALAPEAETEAEIENTQE